MEQNRGLIGLSLHCRKGIIRQCGAPVSGRKLGKWTKLQWNYSGQANSYLKLGYLIIMLFILVFLLFGRLIVPLSSLAYTV